MYFSILTCNDALYQEARRYFIQQGRSDLLSREPSSLIGAYIVTQQMFKLGKTGFSFMIGVYSYEEMYFSTSHSKDMIVVVIDSKKVAVDLECIHPRDESLLENIHIFDSPFSQRENFYLQRCAKECVIKYLNLTSLKMDGMIVKSFFPNHNFSVGGYKFNSSITLQYGGKEYIVHTNIKDDVVMAFLRQND